MSDDIEKRLERVEKDIVKRLDRIESLLLDVLDRNPEALTATGKVQIRELARQMVQEKNSKGQKK